jgi:VanZ family protein
MHRAPGETPQKHQTRLAGFILLYGLFLVVGSLYPFSGWLPVSRWSADFLFSDWPRYITRTDLATNMFVYAPLGYALALWQTRPGHGYRGVINGALIGALFSLFQESGQALLPGRIASNLDLLVNGLGALTGALASLHHHRWLRAGQALTRWRHRWFMPGNRCNWGLFLLSLWFIGQFALLPTPGLGWLSLHLRPLDTPPGGLDQLNLIWFATVFLEIVMLGAFAANLLRPGRYVGAMLLLMILAFLMKLLAGTILLKLKVVGGVLSLETLSAFLMAFWFLLIPSVSRHRRAIALASLNMALSARFILAETFLPGVSALNITGLAKYLAVLWPILTVTWLVLPGRPAGR